MRRFTKIFLSVLTSVYVIAIVAFLMLINHVPWLTEHLVNLAINFHYTGLLISILLLIGIMSAVLLLILTLSRLPSNKSLIYKQPSGRIELSKGCIEAAAESAACTFEEVGECKALIRGVPSKRKLKLKVELSPKSSLTVLKPLSEKIKEEIKKDLAEALSIDVKAIYLHINEAKASQVKKLPRVM